MKKTISTLGLLTALTGTAFAQEDLANSGCITVNIDNLRSSDGKVGVALFKVKEGFPDKTERALEGKSIAAGDHCIVMFENVPYGTYAVSVLHDENGNGKMDKTFIGIPKEGFGTSNNPKIRMGPPSFSESKFELGKGEVTLTISMNYLNQRSIQKPQ
ncbi:MAG: DUF2141 domain-containing protein [Chlorobiaceae bacterium]|nr:DUF2141 domain-containing protein [Chlorobiaceae bacterium]